MWYINAMEYYPAAKRNQILIYTTTWINPEKIMLNERSWSQRTTYYMITFIKIAYNRQIYGNRK